MWISRCLLSIAAMLTAGGVLLDPLPGMAAVRGRLDLTVVDQQTGEPIPCRLHLKNAKGQPQKVRGMPLWHDHMAIPGRVRLDLAPGAYTFEIERGLEYASASGYFTIERSASDQHTVELKRIVDLASEGWYSGDLHVHRPPREMETLMLAEDLHVAPVITWWRTKNRWNRLATPLPPLVEFDDDRCYSTRAGEDEREGGALLYFNLSEPLPLESATAEYPSPLAMLRQARENSGVWVDVEKPFWWDVPVWIASGLVDSIGLANNHLQRDGMLANEAWGKPRDKSRYPDPHGNGLWSQQIYHHLLNCGIRLPPSAGSASGVLPNPLGYNRVYVHCGAGFSYDAWWENFRAGRVVVTNGPLLRPSVSGKLPGHVFRAGDGEEVSLEIDLRITTGEPGYLEIIKNGDVEHSVRLDEWAAKEGRLPPVVFDQSGWLVIRVVSENDRTFRFASTGPYYVEIGERDRRISRRAAQFFLDWVEERIQRLDLTDPEHQAEVRAEHEQARAFWADLVQRANAE